MNINYHIGRGIIFLYKKLYLEDAFVFFITRYFIIKYREKKTEGKPRLFWGTTPIINYKYFANSLKLSQYKSNSVVDSFYEINNKSDFDIYFKEILDGYRFPVFLKTLFERWFLIDYALKNYDIFHISYNGIFLDKTKYWNREAELFHSCNKKIVVMPFGSDSFVYSKIKSSSQQHALLINYKAGAINEERIQSRVTYWQTAADFCLGGGMIDGFSRWDSLSVNFLTITLENWPAKSFYNNNNGITGEVNVIHTPNHRGVKGTEFILQAIEELKSEGLKVKLILLENKKNDDVKKILYEEADILVEQLIMNGHGLSAIEGMAVGIPVLSNLEDVNFNNLFSRYSFLSECPILSSSPENIKQNLRLLIRNPVLRKDLGVASRKYAEKYHSNYTSQILFNKIYDKIWYNKEVDLMNMFHPQNPSSYNNQSPKIEHPLVENKIPTVLLTTLNN